MFKKLLSNLPFNPSLIGQVSFYAKRIHRETTVRRVGFGLVVLAMTVQLFAMAYPPEPTLAASNNDIVHGGFTSREQAVNYCRRNTQDLANILAYYKVSCESLAQATTKTIRSTDYDKQLDSMGRVPQGQRISRTGKSTDEYSTMINGTEYFMRNLWSWDSGSYSSYKVLQVKNKDGKMIMIMYNCGNIITIGRYTPPKPKPKPKPEEPKDVCDNIPGDQYSTDQCDVCPNVPGEQSNKSECYPCPEAEKDNSATVCLKLSKSAANETQDLPDANGTLAEGDDVIVYTLSVKNEGKFKVEDFVMEENLSDVLEYAEIQDMNGGELDDKKVGRWPKESIEAGATLSKKVTVKIKNPVPQTPASASDPGSYDLVMTNVFYGDTVNIKLPQGSVKSAEAVVQTLPNTGPGTTMAVGFLLTAFVGYFFARSRLLAEELDVVRTDFTSTGGMQ
jgi:hypothetical protein